MGQVFIGRITDGGNVALMYIKEYYSAIKQKEILIFAIKWTDLKDFMLSEISQTKTYTSYPP